MVATGVSACTQGQSSVGKAGDLTTTTTAPPLPRGYGLLPSAGNLSDRIVLKSTRTTSGTTIDGTLLVINHGKMPVNLTKGCRPGYEVVLTNSRYVPQVAWPQDCLARSFLIVPGTNRLSLQVLTSYLGCRQAGPPTTEPKCLSSGPSPLPAGNYDAVLVGGGLPLPEPQPVAVTVTRGSA